ncbi:hypothetical protein PHMEG_00030378, partial [Phytophthora megakarya]
FYRPIDPDAGPVRPVEELALVLTRSKVEDVRMDVLEYWHMDTDHCTLTDAEDAIQGRTAEAIVVHVSLRKNILVEFLRRALILSFLDEVPWFQHVPEEFFDRDLAVAEDDDRELGIAEGVNPWPSVPLQPRDSPSPSEHDEDALGGEQDGNEPNDETSLGKRPRPKSKTPAEKTPQRHSLSDVSSNDENTPPRLHQDRAGRQRKYERALTDVQADVATLPPPERKLFRTDAAFWRHCQKPCVWIPMDPEAHKTLRTQLDILDQREPARLYWGSSYPEDRVAESVSQAVWGTHVTIHANRLPVPEPEEYVMPRGRR